MLLKSKKAAIIPSKGIGDALMMMITSEHLRKAGYTVTTVYPKLGELKNWFPGHTFEAREEFSSDEWIVAQNNNLPSIDLLKNKYRSHLSIFYPTYSYNKHGFITPLDRVFDTTKTMADNIAGATQSLVPLFLSKETGITPPAHLSHRLYPKRVLIHHTSSLPEKNWLKSKYDAVFRGLEKRGLQPVFVPEFPTLNELAAFVYESGFVIGNDSLVGHLASNLSIPTLIIADEFERMRLWRPGWLQGSVVTASQKLAKWKFFRKNWQYFISSSHVLNVFDKLKRSL